MQKKNRQGMRRLLRFAGFAGIFPAALFALAWLLTMGAVLGAAIDSKGKLHFDISGGLDRFTRPVQFLAGSCNRLIGVDQQRLQAEFFPAAELVVIPDCGHMLFAEQPQATLKVVRGFLQDNGSAK